MSSSGTLVPQRKRPHTMAEAAVAELREAIYTGDLAPGTPLRLEELARQLDMSVSPVREAVRRLETLGLAVHVPHRGARVSEFAIDDLRDTYDVRLQLETLAARRAAARFTEEQAATARAALEDYTNAHESSDVREARRAHTSFHFSIYESAGSPWLVRVIQPVWENAERYRAASLPSRGTIRERQREHELILEACIRHDADEAGRVLHQHLALTANLVARQMGAEEIYSER